MRAGSNNPRWISSGNVARCPRDICENLTTPQLLVESLRQQGCESYANSRADTWRSFQTGRSSCWQTKPGNRIAIDYRLKKSRGRLIGSWTLRNFQMKRKLVEWRISMDKENIFFLFPFKYGRFIFAKLLVCERTYIFFYYYCVFKKLTLRKRLCMR